jgi:hypothetical protein
MLALIGSLIAFIRDINLSLVALLGWVKLAERLKRSTVSHAHLLAHHQHWQVEQRRRPVQMCFPNGTVAG